jgi:hypothetical protein
LVKLLRSALIVIGCFLATMSMAILAQVSHATCYGCRGEGFQVAAIAAALMESAVLSLFIGQRLRSR